MAVQPQRRAERLARSDRQAWPPRCLPRELLDLEARTDSALVWALVLHRLRAGEDCRRALAATVADLDAHGVAGRFNFLLTDGEAIAATAAGDTLCYRRHRGRAVVASEPGDDEPGWIEVPDRSRAHRAAGPVDVSPAETRRFSSGRRAMTRHRST